MPSPEEVSLAEVSSRQIAQILATRSDSSLQILIDRADKKDETIAIPLSALRLLNDILVQMSQGNTVTLTPIHSELTIQEAADLIHVSRSFLKTELDKGLIPYHEIGTLRRIKFEHLIQYQADIKQKRYQVLAEMVQLGQDLGLD